MSKPEVGTPVTMQQAVTALRQRGLVVCFEQVSIDPTRLTRRGDGSIAHGLTTFPLPEGETSVEALFEALVSADPDYGWEASAQGSMVTIHPLNGGVLEWPVRARDWTDVPWIEALRSVGLGDHGITLFPRGLERRADITLAGQLDELPARRWLSAILGQVGSGHYWNLAGIADERSLVIGQAAQP